MGMLYLLESVQAWMTRLSMLLTQYSSTMILHIWLALPSLSRVQAHQPRVDVKSVSMFFTLKLPQCGGVPACFSLRTVGPDESIKDLLLGYLEVDDVLEQAYLLLSVEEVLSLSLLTISSL